ncbi:MAG: DUF4386 domain-containing protein [Bacteroidota bacterium]
MQKSHARILGVLFILPFMAYGTGSGILDSLITDTTFLQNPDLFRFNFHIAALLVFLNSLLVFAIGIYFYETLKTIDEKLALLYLSVRLLEGVLLIVGIIFLNQLFAISDEGGEYKAIQSAILIAHQAAYLWAMLILALGSLPVIYTLLKRGLLPGFLGFWGLIGYFLLGVGMIGEILGFYTSVIFSIPGGLFEIALGIFFLREGFRKKV